MKSTVSVDGLNTSVNFLLECTAQQVTDMQACILASLSKAANKPRNMRIADERVVMDIEVVHLLPLVTMLRERADELPNYGGMNAILADLEKALPTN